MKRVEFNLITGSRELPAEVAYILERLCNGGYESWLVGGCVRDLLLERVPKDYDICTAAAPEDVKRLFERVVETGIRFNTVSVLFGHRVVEVSSFRKYRQSETWADGGDAIGLRKAVTEIGISAEEDVLSRDFTINGLLFDGAEICDYVDGLSDLKKETIRAIGEPDARFAEDALRMMRAIRLRCQLGFTIEAQTLAGITANSGFIRQSASERIRDELVKILTSRSPADGMRLLRDTGLLNYIAPELEECSGFDQHNPHHDKDVFEHTMAVVENTPPVLTLRLAALLHDIGKPKTFSIDEKGIGHFYSHHLAGADIAAEILGRLRFDKVMIKAVTALVKEHMSRYGFLHKTAVKKLINRIGPENVHNLIDLQLADIRGSAPPYDFDGILELKDEIDSILQAEEPLAVKDLAVNGDDLKMMGMVPGPEMGQILRQLLDMVITNPGMNTRDELLSAVQRMRDGL